MGGWGGGGTYKVCLKELMDTVALLMIDPLAPD